MIYYCVHISSRELPAVTNLLSAAELVRIRPSGRGPDAPLTIPFLSAADALAFLETCREAFGWLRPYHEEFIEDTAVTSCGAIASFP